MAKSEAKLKCRSASNSMPQGYGGGFLANPTERRNGVWRCAKDWSGWKMAKGADPMRMAIAFALFAGATFLAPGAASAVPLALGDHATVSRTVSEAAVEPVGHRYHGRYKHYAGKYPRRYNWSYYPYWRPYQYRYWQFYYPYGGPLF
jgi:hypothetical protein